MHLRHFQRTFIITIASCINFVYAHLLLFIWKEPYYYYYIVIAVASFLIGAVLVDFARSIICTSASLIAGSIISVGIMIAPGIIYGADRVIIDASILLYSNALVKLLIISLPLSLCAVLVGAFIGETVQRR